MEYTVCLSMSALLTVRKIRQIWRILRSLIYQINVVVVVVVPGVQILVGSVQRQLRCVQITFNLVYIQNMGKKNKKNTVLSPFSFSFAAFFIRSDMQLQYFLCTGPFCLNTWKRLAIFFLKVGKWVWILQKWAGVLKARSVFEGTGKLHKFFGLNIFL